MNYSLGNDKVPGKPKKIKRTGPKPTGKKEGEISRQNRMNQFNNKEDQKRVNTTMDINTNADKLVEGKKIKLNDHGIPDGEQQHKKYKLGRSLFPKFRKSK